MSLVGEFALLAVVVAVAGAFLATSADAITDVTRLGRLLVGSLLLAAATSWPIFWVRPGFSWAER
jgi:Ca2+/Na+ antiporter